MAVQPTEQPKQSYWMGKVLAISIQEDEASKRIPPECSSMNRLHKFKENMNGQIAAVSVCI